MIGIDVVDVERFRATLERSPGLTDRLFTAGERAYCAAGADPVVHMAGTLAAKEAVIKALSLGNLAAWARRVEISRADSGAPQVTVTGRAEAIGISITHDGGYAAAVAFRGPLAPVPDRDVTEPVPAIERRGNRQLDRFLDRPSPFARTVYRETTSRSSRYPS